METSKTPTIADMLFEIEADLRARKVTDEGDHMYAAYFVARLELECSGFQGREPNLGYVYNMLATSLNLPLATRH